MPERKTRSLAAVAAGAPVPGNTDTVRALLPSRKISVAGEIAETCRVLRLTVPLNIGPSAPPSGSTYAASVWLALTSASLFPSDVAP